MAKKQRSRKQSPARRNKTRAANPARRPRAARAEAAAAHAEASPPTQPGPAATKPAHERSADGRPKQFSIPLDLVEHLLLGPTDDRRVLQDSPLLGDVWAAYALDPGNIQDVLITPLWSSTAAEVASMIPLGLELRDKSRKDEQDPQSATRVRDNPKVAYLQGLVGAKLFFDDVLCLLVPLTQWWHSDQVTKRIRALDAGKLERLLSRPIEPPTIRNSSAESYSSLERYVALAGLIYWISKLERPPRYDRPPTPPGKKLPRPLPPLPPMDDKDAFALYAPYVAEIVKGVNKAYKVVEDNLKALKDKHPRLDADADAVDGYIFQVSLNRAASAALDKSIPSVKADAAKMLFDVSCKNIVWAVLDSGIDSRHPAFLLSDSRSAAGNTNDPANANNPGGHDPHDTDNPTSRVRKTFDFTKIREIVSNDERDMEDDDFEALATAAMLEKPVAREHLRSLAADAKAKRPINWDTVEKLITIRNPETLRRPPPVSHGTHVAGIIGAEAKGRYAGGMCPDIRLYDLRVLGRTQDDTEFAVIAALQYIRYVNERHNKVMIHGANLSLSIPHNVRNYACGRTPVCNECERLVESGVVVVAAAGNHGFQRFNTEEGIFENYAAFSITDPGNSESVLTVGSTHGNWPHTYGVSFFSSRGPTGDGRLKPDLVAPGERVQSTKPGNDWGPESGTSMAAPHVSGAAAMLLARYEELIGQPRQVKQILCESATDLGRERSFQGHGMLDVLRAFQSI